MKKIIVFPKPMDGFIGEKVWDLLLSDAFSKLRGGFHKELTVEEIEYLREEFEPYCVLEKTPMGKFSVEEGEEISVDMMLQASYELTKFAVTN